MTIQLLLAMAGDIESNPVPINDDSEFCDVAICHFNIRSLKPTVDNVFYKMEIIRHEITPRYQIITLSETWLNDSDCLNDFGIDGFQKPFIKNRDTLGGGVLWWVANSIAVERRSDLETPQTEIIWLEVRANVNKFLL